MKKQFLFLTLLCTSVSYAGIGVVYAPQISGHKFGMFPTTEVSGASVENDTLAIWNRCYARLLKDYEAPRTYAFDLAHKKNTGRLQYADNFLIILQSTGSFTKEWPNEMTDCLRFRIDFGHGKISFEVVKNGRAEVIASTFIQVSAGATTARTTDDEEATPNPVIPPLDGDKNWNRIEVEDTGSYVRIYFNSKRPVLEVRYDGHIQGKKLGKKFILGNREYKQPMKKGEAITAKNAAMVSYMKNFRVMEYKSRK